MSKPATVPEAKRYLRKADVAARYGISERHVERLAAAGQLPKPIYISKFPMWSEAELAAQHGVAIGTVRKAIDQLVADGVLER